MAILRHELGQGVNIGRGRVPWTAPQRRSPVRRYHMVRADADQRRKARRPVQRPALPDGDEGGVLARAPGERGEGGVALVAGEEHVGHQDTFSGAMGGVYAYNAAAKRSL